MKNCRECGAEMNDTALFCSVCGTNQHICNEGAESDEDKYAALEEELFGMENENNTVNSNLEEKGLLVTENAEITQSFDTVCGFDNVKKALLESAKKQDEGCESDRILLGGQNSSEIKSLAVAFAKETGRDLVILNVDSLYSVYIGHTPMNVRNAFDALKEYVSEKQRKVIFVVEQIDRHTMSSDFAAYELVEGIYYGVDTLDSKNVITVMTATNEDFLSQEQPFFSIIENLNS